jgi:hypothetical protein
MPDSRRLAAAAAVVALALPATAAAGGRQAGPATPPTAAAIERSTESFLQRFGDRVAPSPRPGPAPAAAPLLPANRVVSLYGAPQMGQTILGMRSPPAAARKLGKQSLAYAGMDRRPVVGAFDLVAAFATAGGGPDNLYRTRQDDRVIQIYLDQARAVGARLILDIQPGRASIIGELEKLGEWVAQPDVDVAIDPEWNVGRRGIPGQTAGMVSAREVNAVARSMAATVEQLGLPPKLLIVHQFRKGSVRGRGRIVELPGVQPVLNFDGIGSPAAKVAGYGPLATPSLFSGFSVFYRLDDPLMRPPTILGLEPQPDFLLYQ